MIEEDLSVYFSHWLHISAKWEVTSILDVPAQELLKLSKEELNEYYSYTKIWHQAFSHFIAVDIDFITRLENGENLKFDIEYKDRESWYDPEIRVRNITIRAKKYFISLCPVCKKAVNIHLSRAKILCPNCTLIANTDKQRLRRGWKVCKYCGKPLPKEYPNRNYCQGGVCKQRAYRERKACESWKNDMEECAKNNFMAG